jgi:PKD repeat protein
MNAASHCMKYTLAGCLLLAALLVVPVSRAEAQVVLTVELNEWYYCPFVYTWGGATYELDNDIYSVARDASGEYTDYLLLRNAVVPRDGVYSFEVREMPTEQSRTDALALIVVDHPASVSVGVDSSGNVHSYSNPAPPDAAVDGQGSDVRSQVLSRDYSVLALAHNQTATFDFSSVDVTIGAKLVLDVDGFEGEPSGAVTEQVPAIEIQTLAGGAWVTRHQFFPKEFRTTGVFDLAGYLTESKSVRLVSISSDEGKYHAIDYVALDNTPDALTVNVLPPATAVLNGLTDVLGEISYSDDLYAETQGEDIITVTFPFVPLADEQRSFVFVSEGYYQPGEGNSYYYQTWNGMMWLTRGYLSSGRVSADTIRTATLTSYLPDPDGEYKVRIYNRLTTFPYYAQVDWVALTVNNIPGVLTYAMEAETTDILDRVLTSDDYKWNALNRWATFKFEANRPPVSDPGGPYAGLEGALVTFDGSASSDPDGDELQYSWDFGDGATATGVTAAHAYADNGSYTVTLTVSDGQKQSQATTTGEIANVAPTVGPLTASMIVGPIGTEVSVTATFTDPGSADTHTSSVDWGDGTVEPAQAATSPVTGTHMYTAPGVYTVILTVTDDDGGVGQSEYRYVVVYDPTGGSVSGGGWIDSPAGACVLDPTLTGKANFGFISKYLKGATVPTGKTEFQFKAGSLNFHSEGYDWLVVNQNDTNAQYKGSGTINGAGAYKFMLWAGDGSPDTFRIKIYSEGPDGSEVVVYDNGFNQALGGGSIVIHTQ